MRGAFSRFYLSTDLARWQEVRNLRYYNIMGIKSPGGLFFLLECCLILALFALPVLVSCGVNPVPRETGLAIEAPRNPDPVRQPSGSGGIAEEIRIHTEMGSPSSLLYALDIIRGRNITSTEFGRVMVNVNVALLKTIYPAVRAELPTQDPPIANIYSRILREAERGIYTAPDRNSNDYLEHVLPFLAIYPVAGGRTFPAERYLSALPDLERGAKINGESLLAAYFMGVVYENTKRPEEAFDRYSEIWERFPECFPAALGLARVMEAQGRNQEAERLLSDLQTAFPDNIQVKRQVALSYYNAGDWFRSGAVVDDILQTDSRNREFVLMKARILVEQGQLLQAQAPLDLYAAMDPNNKLYLFLRARVQAEAFYNRESALNNLRSIMRSSTPEDAELITGASVYAARLLMESPRQRDHEEGRELLAKLMFVSNPPLEVLSLAMSDAVRREAWAEARGYLARLLRERRSGDDLLAAYTVEREQGNNDAALSYARELYERDLSNEEGIVAYISALIAAGRRAEAARIVESRIGSITGGLLKSQYLYLRSQTRSSEELVMNDLMSSLFEDPRNLNALIALFDIHHERGDERRAVYYLRQALALAPDSQKLKRYGEEYNL